MNRVRPAAALLAAVVATAALLTTGCDDQQDADATPSPSALKISWQDEFDDAAGSKPDPAKWGYQLGGEPQWGNEEWQYYTDRTENAATDGEGNLVISARREKVPGMEDCKYGPCDITSARITTADKFDQAYGKFEARIKVPAGQGLLPAFWAMGDNEDEADWPANGEIDIMEVVGSEPGNVYGTIHGPGYSATEGPTKASALPGGKAWADDFHVYDIVWSPNLIIWHVDDREYYRVTPASLPKGKKWVYDHNFYLLLNIAVGGTWPGAPDNNTDFPAQMLIDYVRAYS
ncbi:glycoside hydrolase family 16 protein [Kribbella koreensis]|uniref:Glycoside hydrolase family 16 protein n=1 Tax=Kribbella koreensis TaxID=57909 RepID=A0ABN1PPR0_9ACTN